MPAIAGLKRIRMNFERVSITRSDKQPSLAKLTIWSNEGGYCVVHVDFGTVIEVRNACNAFLEEESQRLMIESLEIK